MTGADLTDLLGNGKSISLGGPRSGHAGTLILAANGSGQGEVKTDDGTILNFTGNWRVKGDQFCRTWQKFDGGQEVCGDNKVRVLVDGKPIGSNHW